MNRPGHLARVRRVISFESPDPELLTIELNEWYDEQEEAEVISETFLSSAGGYGSAAIYAVFVVYTE